MIYDGQTNRSTHSYKKRRWKESKFEEAAAIWTNEMNISVLYFPGGKKKIETRDLSLTNAHHINYN